MARVGEERSRLLGEALKDEAWRLSLATYAMTASINRKPWYPYAWLRYLSRRIEEALRKKNARVIINAPPRHGKSELLSHWLPTWYLDWFPERRIIETSYGDALASDWGRAVRDEFKINKQTWTRLRQDTTAVNDWHTLEGGGMRTTGVGGSITGKGGDLILVDDPHKNWEDAMSPASRQKLIDWFNSTLYTRLEPEGSILVIMTRWHQKDLTGYLLDDHEDDWQCIRLPAFAEPDDLLGREEGAALCPERFTRDKLLAIKAAIGSHMFEGIYQQNPGPPEGSVIKRDQINYYDEMPEALTDYTISFDLTFDADGSSYVVGQAWARKGANYFLLDQLRGKPDFSGQLQMVKKMKAAWPYEKEILVEKKANGAALINTLRDEVPGIVPINPTSSKAARLMAVQPLFEAGNVWVPSRKRAPWIGDWVEEVCGFPFVEDDDQVDAMTQALIRYRRANASVIESGLDLGIDIATRESPWRF